MREKQKPVDTVPELINLPSKILRFPKGREAMMVKKTRGKYDNQSIALSAFEKELLEVLHTWSGMKPATLARALYYRGVEAFLKDGQLNAKATEEDLAVNLDKYITEHPAIESARQVVKARTSPAEPVKLKSRAK